MKKKRWDTINEIVDRAMDLEMEDREEYISNRCGENEKLKNQVLELLQSMQESETERFLESPADMLGNLAEDISKEKEEPADSALIGETVENYRITELIEHGGMGSVYKAKRTDGAYEKEVAFKLLRRGMDTPANIARFKRERNILANLDHPNIPRLLDGGVTREGLPFLVMDYVDGTPLFEYCDQQNLSVESRLEIFKLVCRTVHYAHKNAVIHRDLKPSNILITEQGKVKVLDFGIAKLLESGDREWRNHKTIESARILTLRYAAPEMIENEPITTATDTYALGILLFELLAGVHPFDFEDKKIREIEQTILEAYPEKPSTRFKNLSENQKKEIAGNRSTSPRELYKILTGELGAIAMKAIRKEPEKRYSTIQMLLDDVERREKNQPISAKDNTVWYRTTIFFRRRKKEISVAAVFIIVIAGFILFYTDQITDERNIARQEARRADDVSSFLLELFDTGSAGDTLSAAGLLQQGLDHLEDLENQPAYVDMLSVMGEAYLNFGDYEKAEELLRKAVEETEREHGSESLELANALFSMGKLHEEQREWVRAEEYFRKAYELQVQLLGEDNPQTAQTLSHFGTALRNLGKLEQAEEHTRRAVQIYNQVYESTDAEMLNVKVNLAYVLRERGKFEEAEAIYSQVIENANQNPAVDLASLANYYNNLGYLYRVQEEYGNAVRNYRKSLELQNESYVEGHPEIINTRRNLASSLYFQGSLDQAVSYLKKNASDIRNKYSTNHWRTASALDAVGLFYLRNKQLAEAEPYLRESVQIYRNVLGNDHLWTAYSEGLLAACLKFQDKNVNEADSLYDHHFQLFEQNMSEFDADNRYQLKHLIEVYSINSENEQIVADYQELLD
ncbi:MAG: tetratricopeptide repeat protein [Balneolaceae bacterium]|nr:tetratricopeptide repeat protein [Balneolaceae bacterium]